MIIVKLVLFASPLIVASMLFLANPAAAFPVDSLSTKTHINAAESQSHGLATLNQINNSNPILDQIGCKCAYCVRTNSQLQGKLPTSHIFSN